jgi:ribosome recycling factor
MSIQPILNKLRPKMDEVIEKLSDDLRSVRTGKASGTLVENILIAYYGTQTPLKNMAQISTPDAFLIVIQPWDANALGDVENSLRNADLGFGVTNDGRVIRLSLPPLTQERRVEFIKLIHQKAEAARVVLRNLREEAWREVQKEEKDGALTEDDKYQGEKELNKLIDSCNDKIRLAIEEKERELKTV